MKKILASSSMDEEDSTVYSGQEGSSAERARSVAEEMTDESKREEEVAREVVADRQGVSLGESFEADPQQTAPLEPPPAGAAASLFAAFRRKQRQKRGAARLLTIQQSHNGLVRERNEDACLTFVSQSSGDDPFPAFGLFIVADGMGGHFDGHHASKLVAHKVANHVLERLYLPLVRGEDAAARPPVQEVMEEAVRLANEALYLPDPEKDMGTTLTAALILGSRLFLVHVGDSRAYLLGEDNTLTALTTDHSIVQALQDAGQLTAAEAAVHPNRNLLYRALMGEPLEQVDTFTSSLPERGTLLLCSDGLWGVVPDAVLQEILQGKQPLADKAEQLVEKALTAGGHDNITVVLVDFRR